MRLTRTRVLAVLLVLGFGAIWWIAPASAGTLVSYAASATPGTIVIETGARRLYLILGEGKALRYPVGVGRLGRQWAGRSHIDGRFSLPNWSPPAAIRHDRPELPAVIAGGSPANPLGAAAMTLAGGNYAIHGTNSPASIGGFVSYGCIRMSNEDVLDLMGRVRIGTPVEVLLE
jgi:lipoprotein-anchoring transpeptidase ErfK/SrfK